MKNKWKEMSKGDKTMLMIRIILSIVVVVLASLQLCGVFAQAIDYAVPLLGVYLLVLSIQEWKQHRGSAILSICLALFIFIVTWEVWFL
ncbi:MAG: DUF3953 domain-containing protein [Clostridia bacterium]|nr:DUF3953 domain-containing protein [Clostridia bacterium]